MSSSVTAKSVVIDIVNGFVGAIYLRLRRVEFALNGTVLPMVSGYTCYASNTWPNSSYLPAFAFKTSLPKTGTVVKNEYSSDGLKGNIRLVVVFDTPITFDAIIINNSHHNGTKTKDGVDNVVITISDDAVTTAVYQDAVTNSTVIFTGQIPEHPASDTIQDYSVPIVIGGDPPIENTLIRNLINQQWSSNGDLLRALFDQQYSFISVSLRALFRQSTTSTATIRNLVTQLIDDCAKLRTRFDQQNGSAKELRTEIIQKWGYLTALRAEIEQRYALADSAMRAELRQVYDLSEFDRLRAELEQIYILAAGEAIILRDDITVTAIVDGERNILESCYNINDEADEESFHLSGEIQLADADEFFLCKHLETIIEIEDDGEILRFMVESPRRSRYEDHQDYVVPLVSESVLLDHSESPLSIPPSKKYTGMAKDIVTSLAAPVCPVDWLLPDWSIVLSVADETVMQLIKRITESVRGIVQTAPDGTLICRPAYPDDMDKLFSRVPDLTVTDQDDFFQIIPQDSPRDGYNAFLVSASTLAGGGLRIETKDISALQAEVNILLTPWQEGAKVVLHHSGGAWVSIVENGVMIERVSEQVEFISGTGSTSKPCFGELMVDFTERDLGVVSFLEDGTLTATIAENSLATIGYLTKYHSFIVRTDRIEDVQVYPEVIYEP